MSICFFKKFGDFHHGECYKLLQKWPSTKQLRKLALRGRKTDVADAEWIADLLRHGLLQGSFIPSAQQRALRDLTRFRTSLVNDRVRAVNRLQKTLEDANLKLASVATDITGVSGRAILHALVAG